jgi:hypothetical protein
VTIPPRAIGVPVALTPGLVPHFDVLTVLGVEPVPPLLPVLVVLPHPAAATTAIDAASAMASRARDTCSRVLTYPHLQVVKARPAPLCEASGGSPCRRHGT